MLRLECDLQNDMFTFWISDMYEVLRFMCMASCTCIDFRISILLKSWEIELTAEVCDVCAVSATVAIGWHTKPSSIQALTVATFKFTRLTGSLTWNESDFKSQNTSIANRNCTHIYCYWMHPCWWQALNWRYNTNDFRNFPIKEEARGKDCGKFITRNGGALQGAQLSANVTIL